ncbi:MAG: sensor histidine kinase, partial [Promethearchaeia archaeon]
KLEINQILEKKVAQIKERYHNRELDIQIKSSEEHIYVCANELLEEVFENLISNAIIHNEDISLKILIKITRKVLDGQNFIQMEFIDNGKGIPDGRKETLLNEDLAFKESVKGMGLGLSLVKKIVDIFNGKIRIEDRVQGDHTKGCKVILLLPETD